jgi:predicted KAP-like P-loop ATPase
VPALVGGGPQVEFVDAPERDPARDLLGRVVFAERVAATLAGQSEMTSVVVGLYGPWGDGKTTLLRFIESRLRSDGHVLVVWFNPWFYKNEAQILEDFLEQIAEALGISLRKKREKVGKRAREVGQAVQGVNVGMGSVSAAGSVIGTVGGLLGDPTLRQLHDRLAGLLADRSAPGRAKRIVVLVDDVDRLDVEQIATVFRMIKLGADFPRISFLLALDQEVVAAALSQRYSGGGRSGDAFLEKIIQVPLSVPKADPSRVAALMNQWLTGILLEHCPQMSFEDAARLQAAMSAWVWPQIATLRAGKRLLSTVQFVVPLMRGEVDPVDQVLLEALRIVFPELYAFAANNKLLLLRDARGGPARAVLQQGIDEALQHASEDKSAWPVPRRVDTPILGS